MAKMNPMFSYSGTFNNVTQVNSRRYGKHMRNKRGTHKPALLNASLQKSVEVNNAANACAKAIKDALDPFRQNFRDASMWGRLVGLFKTHLRNNPTVDFTILEWEEFQFYNKLPFDTRFQVSTNVSIRQNPEPTIRVELTSRCLLDLVKVNATSYHQTLIILFLDAAQKVSTCFEQGMLPLQKKESTMWEPQQQIAQWPIPSGSKTALIVVKGELCCDGELIEKVKLKGMSVVKVCRVES